MALGSITKRTIDALKKGPVDQFLWSDERPGFGVKVTPAGKKVYILQYRMGGRGSPTRRYTIGSHGAWTPDLADKEAARLLRMIDTGTDPAEAKRERVEKLRTDSALAFPDYAQTFLDRYVKPEWARSYDFAESILRLHVTPRWKAKTLPSIRKADVTALFDALPAGKPALCRNTFAVVRKLFNWAEGRGDIEAGKSPLVGYTPPSAVDSRDRVLADGELRLVWLASADLGYPFAPFYRLLAATGQRRDEVAGMDWRELDRAAAEWTLPGERTKNGQPHGVHLNALVIAELDGIAKGEAWPSKGLVFSTNGKTAISGYSRGKSRIDSAMAALILREHKAAGNDGEQVEVAPWRVHDLRRTLVTGLQRLGVRFEVTEAVVNHISGAKSGVAGVYQRHEWRDEKRSALDAWARHIGEIVVPSDGSNVVDMSARRA
jgi:integrase